MVIYHSYVSLPEGTSCKPRYLTPHTQARFFPMVDRVPIPIMRAVHAMLVETLHQPCYQNRGNTMKENNNISGIYGPSPHTRHTFACGIGLGYGLIP